MLFPHILFLFFVLMTCLQDNTFLFLVFFAEHYSHIIRNTKMHVFRVFSQNIKEKKKKTKQIGSFSLKIHTFMHNTRIFQTTHMNRIFWYSIRKMVLHYAISNQILMLTWKKIRDPEECKGPKI